MDLVLLPKDLILCDWLTLVNDIISSCGCMKLTTDEF